MNDIEWLDNLEDKYELSDLVYDFNTTDQWWDQFIELFKISSSKDVAQLKQLDCKRINFITKTMDKLAQPTFEIENDKVDVRLFDICHFIVSTIKSKN